MGFASCASHGNPEEVVAQSVCLRECICCNATATAFTSEYYLVLLKKPSVPYLPYADMLIACI